MSSPSKFSCVMTMMFNLFLFFYFHHVHPHITFLCICDIFLAHHKTWFLQQLIVLFLSFIVNYFHCTLFQLFSQFFNAIFSSVINEFILFFIKWTPCKHCPAWRLMLSFFLCVRFSGLFWRDCSWLFWWDFSLLLWWDRSFFSKHSKSR